MLKAVTIKKAETKNPRFTSNMSNNCDDCRALVTNKYRVGSGEVCRVGETAEFFLHGLGEDWREKTLWLALVGKIAEDSCLPDCTGVRTGVTLVNSWSKLLVSVGLVMVGKNGGGTRLW